VANTNISAIIWDYDGTLVDTRHKNLNVTRNIVESLIETDADAFSALRSLENYYLANRRRSNWREFYRSEFNFSESQIDAAGQMWTAYQLSDDTEVTVYEGIEEVIGELAEFPHGIVSQNSRSSITRHLEKNHLLPLFKNIVGYEEVDLKKQKPEPDGLLSCIEKLSAFESGFVCYIGDHETDVQCAHRANRVLMENKVNVKILSIGACYDSGTNASTWNVRPDYEAQKVEDILDIVDQIKK
jgi:HAD superfamily hydrolase (TIGR01549 family)